ncbi:MAG: 23S rRNA (uracil(1939)-C(5))-methyltransferase RlmD [Candidatus Lambdaproteobacteria bacterium]|nr:23S rRNA (uracil(1939)-C(5))-methyltransferase RlmD [Candidatus Lambdaproteobacteria bacterium]
MGPNTTPPTGSLGPGRRLVLTPERMGAEGRAVARHEGLAVLVARGLPGERSEVELDRVYPRYALAHVVRALEPALDRVEPACPHFAECGGCDWQHLAYSAQLAAKRAVAEEQLRRIGKLEPPPGWELVPGPAPLEYRDRLDFALAPTPQGLAPAFHGWLGAEPVPIARCRLAPAALSRAATAVAAFLAQGVSGGADGLARRVTIQGHAADGAPGADVARLAVTLHAPDARAAKALLALRAPLLAHLSGACPEVAQVAIEAPGPAGRGSRLTPLLGEPLLAKRVGAWRYRVHPEGFFQVNLPQAAAMVDHVTALLGSAAPAAGAGNDAPPPLLLELYCGVGLFSLPLAARGWRVVGAEREREAVRAARRNARAAGLPCRFESVDLDQPGALAGLVARHGAPAAVLVDPPRRGLSARLAEALLALRPARLVYVSCDPATLARDAARLGAGYDLTALRGFDQFCQTHHLELVAEFTPRPG